MMQKIMGSNGEIAAENRRAFAAQRVLAVNVMASPGAGKTSVILGVLARLKAQLPTAVIEGDIAATIDAEKIDAVGVPVVQVNTAGGCHLDANIIREAARELALHDGLLFIENVGNLVCPSAFDLGEDLRLVIASVPEGHDKPFKYLAMFAAADLIILNKSDLSPYSDFDHTQFTRGVAAVNTREAPIIKVSCRTGAGLDAVTDTLLRRYREKNGLEYREDQSQ